MVELIPVKFPDGTTVYIESSDSCQTLEAQSIEETCSIEEVSCIDNIKELLRGQQLTNSIKSFCGNTINSFYELAEDAKPTKATIEFGLNFSLEGDVYLVKSSSEASIKITAEWNLKTGDGTE
ncbi:CU044_2847 family protein [Methanosarcina sp. Z-7115]|uniref:CU044_2847 family protein n=1 Tax=Methanosarcina baikalica TaxID=3073890 RepID=A0ABU2D137_9EURY|nr:CU044_2847 family protein [Methanosarcina sp. Z-7115]MDR7665657.1 CU044_2847 family protein [Methanosarcina sp. Z-7115]